MGCVPIICLTPRLVLPYTSFAVCCTGTHGTLEGLSRTEVLEPHMQFSIIIPAYNAARTLGKTLASLDEFYKAGDEVIVVDDHSAERADHLVQGYPITLTVLPAHAGPATARNRGAELSKNPWLFFLDADVVCTPGTRDLLVRLAAEHNAIQGVYAPVSKGAGIVTQYQNNYYHYVFTHIAGRPTAVCASFCFAIKRHLFIQSGGFDETILVPTVEDEKFGYSLFERKIEIYLCPDLQVEHLAEYNLAEFARRRFAMAYGQAQAFLRRKNPLSLTRFLSLHTRHKSHHLPSFLLAILLLPFVYVALVVFLVTQSAHAGLAWSALTLSLFAVNAGLLSSLMGISMGNRLLILVMFLLDLHILLAGISYGLLHRSREARP